MDEKNKLICILCNDRSSELKCNECTLECCNKCINTWYEQHNTCPQCRQIDTFDTFDTEPIYDVEFVDDGIVYEDDNDVHNEIVPYTPPTRINTDPLNRIENIYATNYNVFRIMSGMGGITNYSN